MDKYELTIPQKNIWFTDQKYNKSALTKICGTGNIDEIIDIELLELAINKVIEKNTIFRCRIKKSKNICKQFFDEYKYQKIDCVKLNDSIEKDKYIRKLIEEQKDLELEPIVEFHIFTYSDLTGGFVCIGSHLVADAWSSVNICSTVIELYGKLLEGKSIDDYLGSDYKDFIESEQLYLNSEKFNKDKLYWENKFEQYNGDFVSIDPTKIGFSDSIVAKRFCFDLGVDFSTKIREFCKCKNITPYMFFLAIYVYYLSYINSKKEIVIGTPLLNRRGEKEKAIIGMCVNNLPLKINLENIKSFEELFDCISKDILGALRHQRYSFVELTKYINEKFHVNSKLYDFVFSYQNARTKAKNSNIKYTTDWNFNGYITESMQVHIVDLDDSDNLKIYYDYISDKLSEFELRNIHRRIYNLMLQVVNDVKYEEIIVLTDDDLIKIQNFNNTGNFRKKNDNINNLFNNIVTMYPNNVAIQLNNEKINYNQFGKLVDKLALNLRRIGVKYKDKVAIIMDKKIETIALMFAILKIGGTYVPILPEEQDERISYILNDLNTYFVVTEKKYEKKFNIDVKFLYCIEDLLIRDEKEEIQVEVQENDIAYIIYTSGSTGNPKGVCVSHKNVCYLMASMKHCEILNPSSDDVSLSLLKYSFDASGIDIYSSLLSGGKLILVDKELELNPRVVVRMLETEKVTRSFLIPKWLEHINEEVKEKNIDLSKLKVLGTGGEILKPVLIKDIFEQCGNLKILNLYGPTETTMFTTFEVIQKENIENNNVTIGKLIPGARALIVNEENQILPVGSIGELLIYQDDTSIENISLGYLNKDDENKKRFIKIYNPVINKVVDGYKTGDYCFIDTDFKINFYGRKDDVVKVNGGYLIALKEVEKRIGEILDNQYNVSVVAVPFNNTKIIVAYLELKKNGKIIENIENKIKENITFYMNPRKIIKMENFPRNNNGKIDRKNLEKMAIEYLDNKNKLLKPKSDTEKILFNIFAEVIKNTEFSITDDFMMDLGIDSLSMTNIFSKLEEFGLDLQDIYTYSNIKDLANFIDYGTKNVQKNIANKIKIKNDSKKFDISTVLLTGVNGFLGIHILYELLWNENVKKIYCVIRNKDNVDYKDRFKKHIDYYFKNDELLKQKIISKVKLLNGDLTKEFFGLEKEDYNTISNEITTVINAAANVRHYGKTSGINDINIDVVRKLVAFCEEKSISLAHISTLSISGFKTSESQSKTFDEESLYIGQKLNKNPYLISKYLAEEIVLNNVNVNSKIFRLGNIMPRFSDGVFQINHVQNAFMNALKLIFDLKCIPEEFLNVELEFSPVDECAETIVKLIESEEERKIYHIVSDKVINVEQFVKFLIENNYDFKIVNLSQFVNKFNFSLGIGKYYIKEYWLKNKVNNYSCKITSDLLETLNFEWKMVDSLYIEKIIKILTSDRW